jgi:hypothetical protein
MKPRYYLTGTIHFKPYWCIKNGFYKADENLYWVIGGFAYELKQYRQKFYEN